MQQPLQAPSNSHMYNNIPRMIKLDLEDTHLYVVYPEVDSRALVVDGVFGTGQGELPHRVPDSVVTLSVYQDLTILLVRLDHATPRPDVDLTSAPSHRQLKRVT